MNVLLKKYFELFVSASRLGVLMKSPFKPHEVGCTLMTMYLSINIISVLINLKTIFGNVGNVNKYLLVAAILIPIWLFHDFLFLRKKRFLKLFKEIETTAMLSIWYFLFTITFFIVSGIIAINYR